MLSRNICSSELTKDIGALPTVGGSVVIGQPFTRNMSYSQSFYATRIRVGSAPIDGGVLILEDNEGVPVVFHGVMSGEDIWFAKATRVLASATIGGTTYTTNCDKMTWLGGMR